MPSIERLWDLIVVLTQKELKGRYKNLGLGYFWSLANPLASAFVYYMVFKFVMKVKVENFPLFIIAGSFPWQWFTNSIKIAGDIFVMNASLIKKVNFPRNLLPFVVTLQDLIHFLISIPILFLFMLIYHKSFSPMLLVGIPILCVIQTLYTYGLSLIIASINLFFRDLSHIVSIVMNFAFYLTPIVYSEDMIPEQFRPLICLNPAAPLIINWRNLFIHGTMNWNYVLISLAYGIFFALVSQIVYRKLSWRFAEVL